MNRHKARENVFCLLFEYSFKEADGLPADIYEQALTEGYIEDDGYQKDAFLGAADRKDELDGVIAPHLSSWRIERVSRVTKSVLRYAAYELLYSRDIGYTIVINEALELARRYESEDARTFVNGVLGGIYKDLSSRGGEQTTEE